LARRVLGMKRSTLQQEDSANSESDAALPLPLGAASHSVPPKAFSPLVGPCCGLVPLNGHRTARRAGAGPGTEPTNALGQALSPLQINKFPHVGNRSALAFLSTSPQEDRGCAMRWKARPEQNIGFSNCVWSQKTPSQFSQPLEIDSWMPERNSPIIAER